MAIDFSEILERPEKSLRESITLFFREAIRTGRLAPGEPIPSSRELAEQLGTSYPNVHHGLSPLVKEGLISRSRNEGTVVLSRPRQLTSVAVYSFHYQIDAISHFQQTLMQLLGNQLEAQGIKMRVVIDNFSRQGLEQMKHWARTDEIQGVICPFLGKDEETLAIIESLSIAACYLGVGAPARRVDMDTRQLTRLAVEGLKTQGCSSIGLISSVEGAPVSRRGKPKGDFYRWFMEDAKEAGLALRPEWIQGVSSPEHYLSTVSMKTRFGFDCCSRLLDLPRAKRPDGLFVYTDDLISGVMLALLKRQVSVPEELKLVLYRNWEIDVPLLKPCLCLGISIENVARELVAGIVAQFNGEKKTSSLIGYESRLFSGEDWNAPA